MAAQTTQPGQGTGAPEQKYLTFELAGEEYGVGVLKVHQIMGLLPITRVPRTPDFIKGVINLRGKVVPIVDLRARFALPPVEHTKRTCIIVLEVAGQSGNILMGIIVDGVSEVLSIAEKDIEPTPSFGVKLDTDYILGLAKIKGGVKTLLDIDRVMTGEQVSSLGKIQQD